MKVGRNEPCPCGSGKKYKKCCGSASANKPIGTGISSYFEFARSTAYKGRIGKLREEFCKKYIIHKREVLERIQKALTEQTREKGADITCRIGCSSCCAQYTEATVKEGEAIVYYLYQNDSALSTFLRKYPKWRETVRQNGDVHEKLGTYWSEAKDIQQPEELVALRRKFELLTFEYLKQAISCPFLDESICSIYPVRPYTCAGYVSISPPEWCGAFGAEEPKILRAVDSEEHQDCSFYYRDLTSIPTSLMPLMVYEILRQGILYLCTIPGFESVSDEIAHDREYLSAAKPHLRPKVGD